MNEFRRKSPFQVGSSLSEDAESYIRRPVDGRLLELLREGELCLLLAPRQCGKSSLLLRARARLREEGLAVAYVDLQKFGKETDPNSWFFSVADRIAAELKIPGNIREWWKEHSDFTPTYRFDQFIENVILSGIPSRVVILFDEIDSVFKLPFSDDFFIGIRAMVNASASDPAFRRLTLALAGVARPAEFVKDQSRTPFNVGQSIPVEDFSIQELQFFLDVLGAGSRPLVEGILKWTGGQPILTQYLAATAYQWPEDVRDPVRLDEFVARHVLNHPLDLEVHFKSIRNFTLQEAGPLNRVLPIYRKVLDGRKPAYNDRDPVHEGLRLAGLVREKDGRLAIRNEIYRRVFGKRWVRENIPWNPYKTAAIGASVALVATLLWFLLLQPVIQPDFRPLQMYDYEWYDREITYTEVPETELDVRFPATPIRKIVLIRTDSDKTEKTNLEIPSFEEGPKLEGRVRTFSVHLKSLALQENKFELRFFGVWGEPSYQTRIVAAYWPWEKWEEIQPEMVAILPGEFMMGQTKEATRQLREVYGEENYGEWFNNEKPRQRVVLTRGFRIQQTEVTQGQWETVMGYNPSRFLNCGSNCPVENVSWNDAMEFIRRMNVLAGDEVYRLPTEAEWEYACRAGTETAVYSGPMEILGWSNAPILDPIAWYGGNSGVSYEGGWDSSGWTEKQYPHERAGTHPVGLKKANPWGLHDMIGNVYEWCGNWYGEYSQGLVIDPVGPSTGADRAFRGGSWFGSAGGCRAASRVAGAPGFRYVGLGFRLAASQVR